MANGWNFADLWEELAQRFPESPALIHGDDTISWGEFDRRANGLAATLLSGGTRHQDKVALYLFNGPEYMTTTFACYKAGLVPVNTNYRYVADELLYLWDNADAVAVVFHGSFVPTIETIRAQLPGVRHWLWVDDGSGPCPDWATAYETAAAPNDERVSTEWERSGDDILMIYTGGTTGMPKGVMWRQDDLIRVTCGAGNFKLMSDPDDVGGIAGALEDVTQPGPPGLPACPLMHGTGWFTANMFVTAGGAVVTLTNRQFSAEELLDAVQQHRVGALTIVGDTFSRPILSALDSHPGRWDISSLALVTSSGVMWSESTKQALLEHQPAMLLIDAFSSSEALGMGSSVSAKGAEAKTAKFTLGDNAIVVTEDGRLVEPGSGERGRVAVGGPIPLGYYKDPDKTAATFIEVAGRRYSCPGDFATVEADGSITLLGRGSVCINTGGEKVFPEEVEEILKLHPGVTDAVVVGVPDERFGQAITAVIETADGTTEAPADLVAHCKSHLAAYKAPRHVLVVDSIGRAPNAKVDYKRHTEEAIAALAAATSAGADG